MMVELENLLDAVQKLLVAADAIIEECDIVDEYCFDEDGGDDCLEITLDNALDEALGKAATYSCATFELDSALFQDLGYRVADCQLAFAAYHYRVTGGRDGH